MVSARRRSPEAIRITGGMHDLLLSKPPVRKRVFAEIARWTDAYAGEQNPSVGDVN